MPAINCKTFSCVKNRLEQAAEFLPRVKSERWVQIDVSDGKFTKAKSWNNPEQLKELRIKNKELKNISIETHLMVNNLRPNVLKWLKFGANRIIFHFENLAASLEASLALNGRAAEGEPRQGRDENEFKFLKTISKKNKSIKFGLAITPKTPVEIIVPFLQGRGSTRIAQPEFGFDFVQLLAVNPGYSGQNFDKKTIKKIKFLKKNHPKTIIEIDGVINPQTAKMCKKAGANIINSGSYIFNSDDPKGAYKKLQI